MTVYRAIRVLEYRGTKEWLEQTLEKNWATTEGTVVANGCKVKELALIKDQFEGYLDD